LKHLLIEAKQKVPDFLANLQSENEQYLNIGGKCRLIFNCRLGHLTRKTVSEMIYNVLRGTLNPTILYHTVVKKQQHWALLLRAVIIISTVPLNLCLCAQEKLAVHTAVDLVTVSQIVRSWRQYRTSRHRTSAARTTLHLVLQTGRALASE